MSFQKRWMAVAAVAIMAAIVVFAGIPRPQTENAEEGLLPWQGSRKETIYFWYAEEELTHYINSAAVAFGEKKNVRVIPVLKSESEYLEAINQDTLHTDKIPDMYLASNDLLEKAYLAGLAAEIEDTAGLCDNTHFPKAALAAVSYEDKIIAYPLYYETSVLVYNATYMEEWARQQAIRKLSGVQEQVNETEGTVTETETTVDWEEAAVAAEAQEYLQKGLPQTVEDILAIADSFDAPETVEGIMKWDVSDIFYNYWIVGNYMIVGGDAGDNEQLLNINNTSAVQCLEMYKALNQFFFIESDTVSYEAVVQDFIEGKLVFTIGTTDIIKQLEKAEEEGRMTYEYGFLTMPGVSEKLQSRSLSVTNAVVINGYSEHKELANDFAAYLIEECADSLYEKTGKASALLQADTDNAALQVFAEEYAGSIPFPKMMKTGNFCLQLEVLFSKVWNGEDVTALVKELAEEMKLQLTAG